MATQSITLKADTGDDQVTIILEGACCPQPIPREKAMALMTTVLTLLEIERVQGDRIVIITEEEG